MGKILKKKLFIHQRKMAMQEPSPASWLPCMWKNRTFCGLLSLALLSLSLSHPLALAQTVTQTQPLASTPTASVNSQLPQSLISTESSLKKTPPSENEKLSGDWKVRMRGRHFEEKQKSFSGTEFALLTSMNYQLISSLRLKLRNKLRFKNDHVQLEYRDEYSSGNIQFSEAVLEWTPRSQPQIQLEAGAIYQGSHSSPIFMSGHSLPGLKEKLHHSLGDLHLLAEAQQTLATAKSFSAERSEAERTPLFHRELIGAEWKVNSHWQMNTYVSHFHFDRLAAVTAADGSKLGHFTLGSGGAAKFRYGFSGWTTQSDVIYNHSKGWSTRGGGFWLTNQRAKWDGQGQSLYLESSFPLKAYAYKLSLSYMHFFKEREAAPAVFSDLSLGGNNRMGNLWGFRFQFEELGFQIIGQLLDVNIIKASEGGRRGKARSYYLGLETLNVSF